MKGPNHLWHIDTNHKLVRWNFIIVGGIDGYSRLPVMLECRDNNKSDTILGPVVQMPITANPRLKINQGVNFSTPKCCSTLILGKTSH